MNAKGVFSRADEVGDERVRARPALEFDATQPLSGTSRRDYADEDDPALTAFVTGLWEELFSRDTHPVPPCPRCHGTRTRLHSRSNPYMPLPQFKCLPCKRLYTRRTGSPMAALRHESKMPAFIRLLSQPIPLEEAARRLRIDRGTIPLWLVRFRQLIEQHDPDSRWIPRVKLGLHYQLEGSCPHCGHTGTLLSGGLNGGERRRAKCPECSRTWRIGDPAADAQVKVSIVCDPVVSAIERRRRKGLPAPTLTIAAEGTLHMPASRVVRTVKTPDIPEPKAQRFSFSQPLRASSPLPRHYAEDTELTAYLRASIAQVLSKEADPVPRCPHCESSDTWFLRRRSTLGVPVFQCGGCGRSCTRVTNTALANSLRKDMVDAFLPWLSQQRPIAHAAEAFGATEQTIKGLVERFRIWLLRLDPSGKYERRVKLGLKVTWPVMHCPKCDQDAPARPHGFARRKSVPAGKLRLFRCTACEGFITVPIENLPGPGTA